MRGAFRENIGLRSEKGAGHRRRRVCHFVDLLQYLIGAPPVSVFAEAVSGNNAAAVNHDSVFITLRLPMAQMERLPHLAEADAALGKERVEILVSKRLLWWMTSGALVFITREKRNSSLYARKTRARQMK